MHILEASFNIRFIATAHGTAHMRGSHLLLSQIPHAHVHGKELAVKIFKTSILIFKDRDKYVTGVS
jgi:serine/threonine-protein kinase RIO1